MKFQIPMFKPIATVAALAISTGGVVAQFIAIDGAQFAHTTTFNSLSGDVEWSDGLSINGVYLKAFRAYENSNADGVPQKVPATVGPNSTGQAYHMGLAGDRDRALGWLNSSATGRAWVGFQYRNLSGEDFLQLQYRMVLEQWGTRNTAVQEVELQYKVHSTGGGENNLDSASWIRLGAGSTPLLGNGSAPFNVNGNEHPFTIEGSVDISINNGQYLTFRLVDVDHPAGDAMIGVESFAISIGTGFVEYTGRGTPYVWLDQYYPGLVTRDDYEAADIFDTDKDGIPAWQEYLNGTDPTVSDRQLLEPQAWNETELGAIFGVTEEIGYSPVFGWLFVFWPNVYQYNVGWLQRVASVELAESATGYWLWSPSLGWVYTADNWQGDYEAQGNNWARDNFITPQPG